MYQLYHQWCHRVYAVLARRTSSPCTVPPSQQEEPQCRSSPRAMLLCCCMQPKTADRRHVGVRAVHNSRGLHAYMMGHMRVRVAVQQLKIAASSLSGTHDIWSARCCCSGGDIGDVQRPTEQHPDHGGSTKSTHHRRRSRHRPHKPASICTDTSFSLRLGDSEACQPKVSAPLAPEQLPGGQETLAAITSLNSLMVTTRQTCNLPA